jgi:hypothetical protein
MTYVKPGTPLLAEIIDPPQPTHVAVIHYILGRLREMRKIVHFICDVIDGLAGVALLFIGLWLLFMLMLNARFVP